MIDKIKEGVKKHNWKRTGIIIGIIFLLVVSIIVTVKIYKKVKNNLTLKAEQKKNLNAGGGAGGGTGGGNSGTNHDNNSGSGSSGNNAGTGSTTTTTTQNNSSGVTAFKNLKFGDGLWSIGETHLYKSPAMGTSNVVITVPDGGFVGTITEVTTGGRLKVKLYHYDGDNIGYDFYAPAKSYIVR